MSSPSPALLRELRGVTRNATALTDLLAALNGLPDDFPKQSLIDICGALAKLPLGSAEGCKLQLNYAHRRLPGIRRAHILDEEDLPKTTGDNRPPVMRDSPLDDSLAKLAFSVSSARELYSDPRSGDLDNEILPEQPLPTAGVLGIAETIAAADTVEARFDADAAELAEIAAPGSADAIALGQHLRDVSGLARLTRAELRLRAVLESQLTSLRYGTLHTLDAIVGEMDRIDRVVDFAHGWVDRWKKFRKRLREEDIAVAKDFTAAIRWAALRLKKSLEEPAVSSDSDDPQDSPMTQEEAEAEARALILAGQRVPAPVARLVRRLDLSGSGKVADKDKWTQVPDLGLLRDLPNLVDLDLYWARFGDFGALAQMRGLTALRIDVGDATDLAPLAGMTALTSLVLDAPAATDLAPLAGMTALTNLDLYAPAATDLAPLAGMTGLTSLVLYAHAATDLAPLAGMTALTSLVLDAPAATDLAPLAGLRALAAVDLRLARPDIDMAPIAHVETIIPPLGRERPKRAPRPGS